MFETREPEIVPIARYRVELVNHGVGWEFYGIRMTHTAHIEWFMRHRMEQLKATRQAEREKETDPLATSLTAKLIDLLTLAIAYWGQAEPNLDHRLPDVPIGGDLALHLGDGVFLTISVFAGGEIPTCGFDETSYN